MKNVLRVKNLGFLAFAAFADAAPLWAQDGARQDNSDIFVWIFLAFCALIIVAQLVPAVLMMFGFAKGMKKKTEPSLAATVDDAPSPKA